MINLYFKNFNFNLSGSIGIMLYSELEKEDFIKKIKELKIDYRFYTFEALKTHFNFNGKIVSPLNFPFKNIDKILSARLVILDGIKVKSLWDAVLLNAVCDFALNNRIIFCIKAEDGFNIDDIFFSYLNYDKNSREYLILDVYKTRLTLLAETRIVRDSKFGGYTSSMAGFIDKINALGFYIKEMRSKNHDESRLIFFNDKKFEIKLAVIPLKRTADSNGEFISKKGIAINTTLTDIYFYPDELIDKIKIFLGTAENAGKPIHCRYKRAQINKTINKTSADGMSVIQDTSIKEISSPHLVIAGAGSGKTRIIVNKFLYLLNFIPADSIIILTFTNNAAAEIKNRITSSLAIKGTGRNSIADKVLNISTFHSFFYSLIKEFHKELGFESAPLIKGNNGDSGKNANTAFISYDEIISYAIELFKNFDTALDIASRFKYILVDEYQDLDFFSDYIIKKLDFARGAVMYAGDDDQAIYGFNGGDSFNILFFDLFFPSGKIFILQNNYRSHYKIIDFCNLIINKIAFRYPKKLTAKNSGDEKNGNNIVNIMQFKNKNIEEKFIIETAGRLNEHGKSTAILVRTQKEESRFKAVAGFNEKSYIGTIHKSKGLEFDIIFITNVSQGNIPHLKSIQPTIPQRKISRHSFIQFLDDGIKLKTDRDDEIKLFYVAVSRAREKVFITYSGEISEFLIN